MHHLLPCTVWLCLIAPALARDIYVNNVTGDDRGHGRHLQQLAGSGGPVRSIAKALRLAATGDRIVVAATGEPYRESISLTGAKHSGTDGRPFVIEGNGATLLGSAPIRNDAWTYLGGDVYSFQPARLGSQQLFIGAERRVAIQHPVPSASINLPPLEPLEWCLWMGKLCFRVEPGRLPDDYELSCCHLQTGITLYHVRDVAIGGFTIEGFHVAGLSAADGVGWALLSDLTCRANARSGISVCGSSHVEITRCVLSSNGRAQLFTDDYSHTSLVGTQIIDDTASAILRRGGEITTGGVPILGER
jgi:hypothetical protein